MSASIHDKLNRVRKPRVHITYEVETEGAEVERSCRSSSACWATSPASRPQPLKPLKDRKFIQIDRDNFNDVMARMTPGLKCRSRTALKGTAEMAVKLKFNAMEDFRAGTGRRSRSRR